VLSFIILKCNLHLCISISESLNADSNWSVTHVRVLCLLDRVEISVNNSVQVSCNAFSYFVKELVVKLPSGLISKLRKRNRSQITDSNFVLACIFNDFCAQI
jgi:hypothetical protein